VKTAPELLGELEKDLKPEAKAFEVRARRFLAAYIPALIVAIAASGHWTSGVLVGLAASVAITVLGESDPMVPWSRIAAAIENARWASGMRDYLPGPPPPKRGGPV
jgi:hypothetical protein